MSPGALLFPALVRKLKGAGAGPIPIPGLLGYADNSYGLSIIPRDNKRADHCQRACGGIDGKTETVSEPPFAT